MSLPSRSVSDDFKKAIFDQETGQVFLPLLEIWHSELAALSANPLRFVRNYEDIDSTVGGTYAPAVTFTGFPFSLKLPDEDENRLLVATVEICNVDRTIVEAVRTLSSAPDIKIYVVLSDDPDVLEIGPIELKLRKTTYDSLIVRGELYDDYVLDEVWPAGRCTPRTTPGLF